MPRGLAIGIALTVVSAFAFGSGALFAKPVYAAGVGWHVLMSWRFLLGAAAAWAWIAARPSSRVAAVGPMRATGWTMAAAGLLFVPLSLPEMRAVSWGSVSLPAWAGLVYGATLGMVVAMALWGKSVHRLGPERTMVYAYLEPVSAVAIAAAAASPASAVTSALPVGCISTAPPGFAVSVWTNPMVPAGVARRTLLYCGTPTRWGRSSVG